MNKLIRQVEEPFADFRESPATFTAVGLPPSESARITALIALLDRGHGKPGQAVDLNARVEPVHVKRLIFDDVAPAAAWPAPETVAR